MCSGVAVFAFRNSIVKLSIVLCNFISLPSLFYEFLILVLVLVLALSSIALLLLPYCVVTSHSSKNISQFLLLVFYNMFALCFFYIAIIVINMQ